MRVAAGDSLAALPAAGVRDGSVVFAGPGSSAAGGGECAAVAGRFGVVDVFGGFGVAPAAVAHGARVSVEAVVVDVC